MACCVLSRYTESRGILSQLTAEMSTGTNTTADSPRSVFSRENQDHKGRGRKLPECVGALPFFLVGHAICSSWLMEEKLKSQETKMFMIYILNAFGYSDYTGFKAVFYYHGTQAFVNL